MKEVNVKKSFSQKMKTWKKRALAYALSVSMLMQTDMGAGISYAAEGGATQDIDVLINNESIDTQDGQIVKEFEYREPLNATLTGVEADAEVAINMKAAHNLDGDAQELSSNTLGEYYVSYYVTKNGATTTNDNSTAYGYKVVPTKVAAPENLHWVKDALHWDAVASTVKGGTIESGVVTAYTVKVYKDDQENPIGSFTVTDATSSANFSNHIFSDSAYRQGAYTFTVQAIVQNTYADCYADAVVSERSAAYIAPLASVNTEAIGVESVLFAGNNTEVLLLPGTDQKDIQVQVIVKDGFNFANDNTSWQVSENVTGISFDNFSSSEEAGTITYKAQMHIADDYSGPTEFTVTPVAVDQTAPVIKEYKAGIQGTLTATAQDAGTGIKYYAFSTKPNAEDVTFIEIADNQPGEFTIENEAVSEGGAYYFFVKDQDGNTAKSDNTVAVTKVVYHDYYENNVVVSDCKALVTNLSDYSLKTTSRAGYVFAGWFLDDQFSDKVESLETHQTEGGCHLYAKWEAESLEGTNVSSYSATYDGQEHNLSVTLPAGLTGNIQYQWQKKNGESYVDIQGADAGTYSVKNVEDSGEYRVIITVQESQINLTLDTMVSIGKATVKIKAKDKTVSFLSEAPTYELVYLEDFGLLESDETEKNQVNQEVREAVTINCAYIKGSPIGKYYIYVQKKDDSTAMSLELDNYVVEILHPSDQTQTGILTVTTKEDALSAVFHPAEEEFDPEQPVFTYALKDDGSAVEYTPDVLVKDGETILTEGTDYTVSYKDNNKVGTAKAIVTFQGNYSGSITLNFTISSASREVTIRMSKDRWIYGDATGEPQIVNWESLPTEIRNAKVTYYYAKAATPSVTGTALQKDAGSYQVYAVLSGMDNYADITTNTVTYEVQKRELTLTAASLNGENSVEYDGTEHQIRSYTLEGDFAPGEGFNSVTVALENKEGAGREVGTYTNTIQYTLSSITNQNNYDIHVVEGEVVINAGVLSYPSNAVWSSSKPGEITWVPISKEKLEVKYEIKLYAQLDQETILVKNGEKDSFIVEKGEGELPPNKLDLSSVIREYAGSEKPYTYYFTIQTFANGGENQNNYVSGDASDMIGPFCTAVVTMEADEASISSAYFNDDTQSQKILVLQGESFKVTASAKSGYGFNGYCWSIKNNNHMQTPNYSLGDSGKTTWMNVYTYYMSQSTIETKMCVSAKDQNPEILSYTGSNAQDLSYAGLKFEVKDSANLSGWMLTTKAEKPAANAEGWNAIPAENKLSFTHEEQVSEAGAYYLWVKDSAGNVVGSGYEEMLEDNKTQMVYVPINVYEIKFEKGESAYDKDQNLVSPSGTMNTIYKVENTTIKLPDITFRMEGFAFQNWHGESGIYENKGSYGANRNDTLTAYWTNHAYDYQVIYHYEGLDGSYPDSVPAQDKLTFNALYGTEISYDTAQIQKKPLGFELDTNQEVYGGEERMHLSVKEEGKVLHIYYKRSAYTINYQVYLPEGGDPLVTTETQKYGADLSEAWNKPEGEEYAGYHFVGWFFEDTESNPLTMPASNITATGRYERREAQYHVYKYLQKLDEEGQPINEYEVMENPDLLNLEGLHGEQLAVDGDFAGDVDGFSFRGVIVNNSIEALTNPEQEKIKASDTAEIVYAENHAGETCIHLYYTRNFYKVNLKVWQGEIGKSENLKHSYEVATLCYGAPISDEKMEKYNSYKKDDWKNDIIEGYFLFEDVIYSTGETPVTMPAGDLSINRQFVPQLKGTYYVEIWVETDTDGVYTPYRFNYEGTVGDTVTLGNNGTDYTINYNSFSNAIAYFDYYSYKSISDLTGVKGANGKNPAGAETVSGKITATESGEEPLVLRVFMERKTISTTIHYYYNDGTGMENVEFATVTKSRKWGEDAASSYYYEPLAYFDTVEEGQFTEPVDSKKLLKKVGEQAADVYNFRSNSYVVNYTSRYYLAGYHYPKRELNTLPSGTIPVSTVEKEQDTHNMGYLDNVVNVYYTKLNPEAQKIVKVVYNKVGASEDIPLAYTYNGQEYQVYIANEAYFYKDAQFKVPEADYEEYPGLAYTAKDAGKYEYTKTDANIKTGFEKITVNEKEYYIEASTKRIYIPDNSNQFYCGHMIYYAYPTDGPGYEEVTKYMEEYKEANYPTTIAINNRSLGSKVMVKKDENDTQEILRINFYTRDAVHAHFVLNGIDCYQNHQYPYNQQLDTANLTCNHEIHEQRSGYEIVWYKNLDTNEKYSGTITPIGDFYLYGRYEKLHLQNKARAYYQLPYTVTLAGADYSYFTEKELEMLSGKYTVSSDNGMMIYTYNDEESPNNGQVFMVEKTIVEESFHSVSVSSSDFEKTGFSYDKANANNLLNGYAEGEAIQLRAYYVRNRHTVTVDSGISGINKEVKEYLYGQKVEVNAPVRGGYSFPGWTVSPESAIALPAKENQSPSFTFIMPDQNLTLSVSPEVWNSNAVPYTQEIWHYFQNTDLNYNTALPEKLQKADSGVECKISFNGTAKECKFVEGLGAYFVDGTETYYFAGGQLTDGEDGKVYIPSAEKLVAIRDITTPTQNTMVGADTYQKTQEHYAFSHINYLFEREVLKLVKTGDTWPSFKVNYGMTVEYFYTLVADYDVKLEGRATDGGSVGQLQLFGEKSYFYGEEVALKASVPAGYTFLGWYAKDDLKIETNSVTVKEGKAAICTDIEYKYTCREGAEYVALLQAGEAAEAVLTPTGISVLSYGYKSSPSNAVTAKITYQTENYSSSMVQSYSWKMYKKNQDGNYEEVVGLTEQNGASFLIPTGLEAGDYKLDCDAVIVNRYTGRTITTSAKGYELTIAKKTVVVSSTNYDEIYDALAHSIMVQVNYAACDNIHTETYYSSVPLNEGNYATAGVKDMLSYKDVKLKENKEIDAYTIYYYVVPAPGGMAGDKYKNYQGAAGSATVKIRPKQITLASGHTNYSKVYDGTAEVLGSLTDENSDKYKLVHGTENIYEIEGILENDKTKAYIIDCNATFDDRHTTKAKTVTLSNIKLAMSETEEDKVVYDNNYIFEDSYTITLSGYITKMPIEVSWDSQFEQNEKGELEITYNGTQLCPTATITTTLPEADLGHLQISSAGGQKNCGTYEASLVLTSTDVDNTLVSDFVLTSSSVKYTILQRPLVITPKDRVVNYNGSSYTLEEWTLNEGGLVQGHSLSCEGDKSYTSGVHVDIAMTNVSIKDEYGTELKDNYSISCVKGTLTITSGGIVVNGIKVKDKIYDGTTSVKAEDIDLSELVISGVREEDKDKVSIDRTKIVAAYESAIVGEEKTVNLDLSNALVDATGGYCIVTEGENASQNTATADITKKTLTLIATDQKLVYGTENPGFAVSYSGFATGESQDNVVIEGILSYKIAKVVSGESTLENANVYEKKTSVGNYHIYPIVGGLSSQNYDFTYAKGSLEVCPRPLQAVKNTNITDAYTSKAYDGNVSATVGENGTVTADYYKYAKLENVTESGPVEGDSIVLSYTAAGYNSKDVASANTVTVSGLSINNSNYALMIDATTSQTQLVIDGKITAIPLEIKAVEKKITYGATENPSFTVTYEGFIEEEATNHGDITGTLTYACDYDCGVQAKRDAGTYDITPQGVTSSNYTITFTKNTLTVEPATLTIKLVKTGEADAAKNGWNSAISVTYGRDVIPTLEAQCQGLKYEDKFDLTQGMTGTHGNEGHATCVKGSITYDIPQGLTTTSIEEKDVITAKAGDYTFTPKYSEDNLTVCGNYKLQKVSTTLRVAKLPLTVSGLRIKDRVYDGTNTLYQKDVDHSNVNWAGLLAVDRSYIDVHSDEKTISVTGTYEASDVLYDGTTVKANKVTFSSVTFGTYLTERYVVDTTSSQKEYCGSEEGYGKIQPRPVKITANDISVAYGSPTTMVEEELDVSYEKAVYDEKGQLTNDRGFIKSETADKTNVTLRYTGYSDNPYTVVGSYDNWVEVENFVDNKTNTAKSSNYHFDDYVKGKLSVTQNQLSAPTVNWSNDENKVGTVTWTAVSGIGDVTVAGYEITLYKVENKTKTPVAVSTVSHASSVSEYNYAEKMHENGAGEYVVGVKAIASESQNEGKKNVADSSSGYSNSIFAAKVIFAFDSDTKTQGGKGDPITIYAAESYVMIAGEKNIPIRATLKNATGYTIHSVTATNSCVTIADATDGARTKDANGNGDIYESTVSMANSLNTAQDITVKLTLDPRPAKVSFTVASDVSSVKYGYSETGAPKLTATVAKAEGDNISTEGYDYSYQWQYQKNGSAVNITGDQATVSFPVGQTVTQNPYRFRCIVTATRKDNGEKVQYPSSDYKWNPELSYVGTVAIEKADFTADLSLEGWEYGQSRKVPVISNPTANGQTITAQEHSGLDQVQYTYYVNNQWVDTMPTDVGSYKIRAYIPASTNYSEYTKEADFAISRAKLSSPSPVSINVSDSAAYGHATWTPANPVKENAGVNAASEIDVTYEIDVWKWNEQTQEWEEKDMINDEDQSHHDKDITHDIQEIGEYKVSVTAKSNNEANCANSDTVESAVIKIGATISVKYADEAAELDENNKYTKEYDGENVILTANYNGGEEVLSYNWYKGNTLVQESSSKDLVIKHVEDSGSYTCAVILKKENGEKEDIHTPYARINITPRPVTLTSDGGEKVYDGQPLLKKEQGNVKDTKTDDASIPGFVTGEGAVYSEFNETQINVGESNNTFTYTLKEGTTASDYTITQSYGAFKITKRPITFKGEMVSKMYTGEKQNSEGFSYTPNGSDVGIVNGHVVEVEYKAEGTEVGSYDGTFTAVKIYSDTTKAEEVTDNYEVTRTTGTLTITQSDADWAISLADSSEYTYKAEPYATDKEASCGAKTGVTSFKYSFSENGFEDSSKYVTDLSQLKKTNAGTYPIYVQATNPNYSKVATTNANLIIKKRPVTFTGKSEEKQYTGNEITIHTLEVSGDGLVEGHNHNVVFEAKGTDSNTTEKPNYQGVITEKSAVKIYNGNEWSAENDVTENYDITVVAGTLRIKSLSLFTISMADSSNLTYNKLEQATNQLPDSSDAIQKSKITYSYSFTDDFETATTDLSTLTKVEAGTYPIYVWATHPDYSNTATCQANLIINKAPANIAITPVGSKTYGDSAFDLSVTKDTDGDSTFTSDNETVLMVDATGKVSIQNAGTAKLTVTTPETNNYLVGTAEIDITVAKKDATLIISNVTYNKTYGDDDFVIGDLTTEGQSAVTYESSDSTVASVDASGKVTIHKAGTAIITLKMAESGNYNEISTTATVIVSPKAITVTADHKEKIYGEDDSVFEYSCTPVGLVGQDTLQVSYEREEGENQGTYLITPVVTPDDNYVIDSVKGTLTIKKKAVIAELSIDNKVYDGSSMATVHATIPQNEMVGTDVIVIEGITAEFADANVGTQKTVTANVNEPQFSGSGYENYDITIVDSATADITAKQITVTITPNGGEYNGTIVPAEGALNGLVEGENPDITLLYSGTANDGTQLSGTDTIPPTLAGTYVVTASITDTNYELVGTVTSDYVVERAGANLQFTTGESKIYLDPDFTLEVTKDTDADVVISGGDSAVLELMNDYVVVIHDVGKATFTAHSEETANYAEGNATLTITVDKKESQLVITEIEYVKTYGDEDFTIGQISFDGESTLIYISDKEEVATIDATGMVSVKSVGEAIITVSAAESDHYKENSLVVKVRVEPKEVIVKAQDSSKVYAGEDPVFTYSTEGVVPGDQLTVSFIRAEGENVGDYEINPVVVEDSNYRIICKKGVLTIEPRDISNATVTLGSGLYYNEKEQHQEIQSVILTLEDGRELEVTYEVEDAKATKPGVYTLKVVGKGNFTGTTEKQFTIVQNEEVDNKFEIGEGYIVVTLKTEKETDQTSLITHKREIIEYLIETGDLDGEMLAMIADGGTIEIILHVKDGEKTVSSESKQLIQEHIEDFILGQYLDITLSIYVRKNDVIEKEIAIKETPDKIYLVLSVSQEMLADNPDGFSEICVVRNHDGQVEFLNTEYYESTQKLSFGTDRFSDYAIVYKKKVVENTMDENNSENQSIQNQDAVVEESNLDSKVKSPKTGDDTDLLLWYLAFAFCGAILTGSNVYVKRRKNRKF